MSVFIVFIPAALLAGVVESLPKSDRKIRRQRGRCDKRWVW